jgi:hypothetical protein
LKLIEKFTKVGYGMPIELFVKKANFTKQVNKSIDFTGTIRSRNNTNIYAWMKFHVL